MKRQAALHHQLVVILLILTSYAMHAMVLPYSFPPEFPTSDVYKATVGDVPVPALQTERGAILSFGMNGPVELRIQLAKAPKEVVVRPLNAGIKADVNGTTITFRLPRPMNLSVEVDGDLRNALLVFANPAAADVPDKTDPKVKFFEAGKIHEAGEMILKNGETLYVEGGAVIHGVVRAKGARNVSVRGAGIIDATPRKKKINMLVFRECENVLLENVIVLNPFGWTIHLSGSEKIRLTNTRVIGWRANCDGLDIEYCRNVRANRCFWQTSDDCVAVKAIYPPGVTGIPFEEMINPETLGGHTVPRIKGDVAGDIVISDSILWNNSGGQTFEIGFELRVDKIRGVTFRNCDIIRGGVAFSIHNGDSAIIEDLLLEDVRVEQVARLVDFSLGLSIYSDDCPEPYRRSNPKRQAPPKEHRPLQANNVYQWYVPADADLPKFAKNRGLIRNVIVRDMHVGSAPRRDSILSGYSPTNNVSNIVFEGLEIEGKPISSAEEGRMYLKHVEDIHFRPGSDRKDQ